MTLTPGKTKAGGRPSRCRRAGDSTRRGEGTRFQLELPLTLSVARTLLVEVGAEAYAVPLAYIRRALKLARGDIELLEGRPHFNLDGRSIGLVTAHQILGVVPSQTPAGLLAVVVLGDATHLYGLIVDRFLGEIPDRGNLLA